MGDFHRVSDGVYAAEFTGVAAGTPVRVAVTANGVRLASASSTITVSPASVGGLAVSSGNNQSGTVGNGLALPLRVLVTDLSSAPLAGATVTWTVTAGDGTLAAASSISDASGLATVSYTLGTVAGANAVVASVPATAYTATFTATGNAGTIHHFGFTSLPTTVAASAALTAAVGALDAYGNAVTGYAGTVHFSSSDSYAVLPADYAFVAGDSGSHSFSFKFRSSGSRTLTVADTGGSPTTTSSAVTVSGAPALAWNLDQGVDFGDIIVGQDSFVQDVFLLNDGVAAARGCAAAIVSDAVNFAIVSDACGTADLLPGETCRVQVRAPAVTAGTHSANLRRVCTTGGTVSAALTVNGSVNSVTEISGGSGFACALLADGTVKCWGANSSKQLGDGTTIDHATPVAVSGLTGATQIAAGAGHVCALIGGAVKCWGGGTRGQLGNGASTSAGAPVAVSGITTAIQIAAGVSQSCAVLSGGTVKCWGSDDKGELGDAGSADSNVPVAVAGVANAVQVATGYQASCALLGDGTLRCWGVGSNGRLGNGGTATSATPVTVSGISTAVDLRSGNHSSAGHFCALLADGTVKCWGANSFGQLGDGTTTDRKTPVAVSGVSGASSLRSGPTHACALIGGSQTVKCWGENSNGQLGDGTNVDRSSPVAAGFSSVSGIGVGYRTTYAIRSDHVNRSVGLNSTGQLANGRTSNGLVPAQVRGLSGMSAVSSGTGTACALYPDGSVKCWGDNTYGQVGDGTTVDRSSPTAVSLGGAATEVAAGDSFGCALLDTGSIQCWGRNNLKQLGSAAGASSSVPVAVSGVTDATHLAVGGDGGCAVRTGGGVACWGRNTSGQCGDGTGVTHAFAVAVSGITTATQVARGSGHACAVLADGTLNCWGANANGQLGDGTQTQALSPVAVNGVPGAARVVAVSASSCALLGNGTAKCWGSQSNGQLGNGASSGNVLTPTAVTNLTGATAISGLSSRSCALLSDGGVRCWGDNSVGSLGDGSLIDRKKYVTPIGLPAIASLSSLTGVGNTFLAIDTDGNLWGWGANTFSQLADVDLTIQTMSGL